MSENEYLNLKRFFFLQIILEGYRVHNKIKCKYSNFDFKKMVIKNIYNVTLIFDEEERSPKEESQRLDIFNSRVS